MTAPTLLAYICAAVLLQLPRASASHCGGEVREPRERATHNVVPPKVEYSRTEAGMTFKPILDSIVEWWLAAAHKEILRHNCGSKARAL